MKIVLYSAPYYTKHCQCTYIGIEGIDYTVDDKRFRSFVADRPMTQWLLPYTVRLFHWRGILAELLDALNDTCLDFVFYGLKSDFEVFCREIRIQEQSLACEYRTALQISVMYGCNPWDEALVEKIVPMLTQTIDASASSNIAQLIEAKRDLLKQPTSMCGKWIAQSDPSDEDKKLLMEVGMTEGKHEVLLDAFILDGERDADEQALFCIKYASCPWEDLQCNKRIYMLVEDQQNGKNAVERLLSVMREKGHYIQNIVAVTSYKEIVSDIKSVNYLMDCYIPRMLAAAIDELMVAWNEIPSDIVDQELYEVRNRLATIQRPRDWINSLTSRLID